ncbi:hypothetical protein AKG34_14505 [Peribacillus butanolivorans]|nr:hypothetical protein AKG34_14505 [Peribacillus butanolivorans]
MPCVRKRGISKYHYTSTKPILNKEGRMKAPLTACEGKGGFMFKNYISIIKIKMNLMGPIQYNRENDYLIKAVYLTDKNGWRGNIHN